MLCIQYNLSQEAVHGLVCSGSEGKSLVKHAKKAEYFIHPIFRDTGFFMLLSQFYPENNFFLFCYLEDFKKDPAGASPLMTYAIFNDLTSNGDDIDSTNTTVVEETHDETTSLADLDLTLIRAEVLTKGISDDESLQIITNLKDLYLEKNDLVDTFNNNPEKFDVDDYISQQNQCWKKGQDNA